MSRTTHRTTALLALTLTFALATTGLTIRAAQATLPGIPSKATAQTKLNALSVAAQGSTSRRRPRLRTCVRCRSPIGVLHVHAHVHSDCI